VGNHHRQGRRTVAGTACITPQHCATDHPYELAHTIFDLGHFFTPDRNTMTVTSNSTSTLSQFASALAKQQIQILDLTNKLSADTPTLRLPDPFPNLVDFSLENVAHFND